MWERLGKNEQKGWNPHLEQRLQLKTQDDVEGGESQLREKHSKQGQGIWI